MIQQIIMGFLCVFVGALLSFVITILTTKNIQKAIAKEITLTHEQVYHKESFDSKIDKHKEGCPSAVDYKAMRAGIVYLVTKEGGNLHDLGLS